MNKTLERFFTEQRKINLIWRAEYWVMSMLVVLEIARTISEMAKSLNKIAIELRKTRLNLL